MLALAAYILIGIASVPFHGDEAMQIIMSRDAFMLFLNRDVQALTVTPPYRVDSPNWLRLINGSVNIYTVGLSLQAAGYSEKDLPSVWQWQLSYDENVGRGHRPSQVALMVSRVSSAVFLAVSVMILFGIGWQVRGRWVAYIASGLYALNPVVLLNGRRAMMEGTVLCFGLLAILVAILICKGRDGWRWWVALGIASGLTLASKHSGIVFVGAALGWVVMWLIQSQLNRQVTKNAKINTRINHRDTEEREIKQKGQMVARGIFRVGMSVTIMVGVFIALSPALWNDPMARLGDVVSERSKLLDSQVKAEPNAPTEISERVIGILTQPFIQAPVYFEAGFWANAEAIQREIAAYEASAWRGLYVGNVVAGVLTLLAIVGIAVIMKAWRTWEIGVVVWLAVTVASLLVNPLPWQRYYLTLYPLACLLTAIGSVTLRRWVSQRRSSPSV